MQATPSLIAPKRPPRQPSASDVESFNSAKSLLDELVTDIDSIDQVSASLIDQLHEDRSRIAQEVRPQIEFEIAFVGFDILGLFHTCTFTSSTQTATFP